MPVKTKHHDVIDIYIKENDIVAKRKRWHADHMRCPSCLSLLKKEKTFSPKTYSCQNENCITRLIGMEWNQYGKIYPYNKHSVLQRTQRFAGHGFDGFINECLYAINSIDRALYFSKRDISKISIGKFKIIVKWLHIGGEIRLLPKTISFFNNKKFYKKFNIVPLKFQIWMDDREYLSRSY